ncbi:hypothetical protein DFH07DRAFT_553374 [Mycena maculata]|uniref:Uncharacterized protein n=1 Tax=Mycena maculata TaxID=230809 RepID=A0AAD7ISD6_9AGAR|nr:hypothetical protein DFH07DRAFT_553374 [Mycena maculata]
MASFLTLFCCCGHRGVHLEEESGVDETSHLIPSNLESTPTVVFTNHQRIQERLVTIVRAKERKMVNVNSQIPFNLHNRVITPNPSLSRSVSLSTGHLDHANVAPPSTADAREPLTVQLRSPPSPLGSGRNASQSKSRSLSLSRNNPDGEPPNPILNVRLVNTHVPQRVGRPRHPAFSSDSSEYPKPSEIRPSDAGDPASQSVSVTDGPPATPVATAVPPSNIESLDEICLSWGDSDT